MKHLILVWFVRCPSDDPTLDASWQPSLHPHIYHMCRTCGAAVHAERYDERQHALQQAGIKRQKGEGVQAAMDRMYAQPTQHFITGDTQ